MHIVSPLSFAVGVLHPQHASNARQREKFNNAFILVAKWLEWGSSFVISRQTL